MHSYLKNILSMYVALDMFVSSVNS